MSSERAPTSPPRWRAQLRLLLSVLLITAAYYLGARAGLTLAYVRGNVTVLWPPAAVALVALFSLGARYWPAVALGAVLSTSSTGAPLPACLTIGLTNTAAALLGLVLLRRAGFQPRLERLRDVVSLLGLGAMAPALLSATLGVLAFVCVGMIRTADAPTALGMWWLGDTMGVLVFAPPLLTLTARRPAAPSGARGQATRLLAVPLLVVSALTAAVVFRMAIPVAWLLLPLPAMAALWLGPSVGAWAACVIACIATWRTAAGLGPYHHLQGLSMQVRVALLEGYLAILILTTLLLAAAVAELRAAAFERARLLAAEAEAREREVLREMLMGIVGHDLRNPLAAIKLSAAALLRRDGLPPRERRSIERIGASAERMARLIDQLLDFTRSRLGGGMPVDRGPADLHEVCRQVLTELRLSHPNRALNLSVAGSGAGLFDRDRLAQVVSNLVGNALQHGRDGGPIDVRVHEEGAALVLEVFNESVGGPLPTADLPALFEPFHSLSPNGTRMDRPRGLGLGLYIVKQVVQAHGGSVQACSDTRGMTITVRLPRDVAIPALRSPESSRSPPAVVRPVRGVQPRVL